MYRLPKKNVETYEMHRKKIRRGIFRDKIVLLASILLFIAGFVYEFRDYFACLKKTEYFPVEELESYEPPVVLLSSKAGGLYFISLDNPENKYVLEEGFRIYDYDSTDRTLLYSDDGEAIYEYDIKEGEYKSLIEKDSVCKYLNMSQNLEFEYVYYYFDKGMISFAYGGYLIVYDVDNKEFIYSTLCIPVERSIYGWLTPQTILASDNADVAAIPEIVYFKYNICTNEKKEIPKHLGSGILLSQDKTMGCSRGCEENIGGSDDYPVYIWNTCNYKIKKLVPGAAYGSTCLSGDNKYVMLGMNWYHTNEILCIKLEDKSECQLYTTEDYIVKILW